MSVKVICLSGLLLLCVGGLGFAGDQESPDQAKPGGTVVDPILMKKDKTVVTLGDFEARLSEMPEDVRGEIRHDKEAIKKILEDLYVNKRLAQEARDNKIDLNPQLQKRIELAVTRLLAQSRLDAVEKEAPRPDFEALAKEKYLANPEMFEIPEEVHASHILIGAKGRTEEDTRKLVEKVRAEALAGKQPFSELAKKYSEDPSAGANKGDLGFFRRGMMVKPFEDAAFSLKTPGEISSIVKSDFGYHIIRFEGRTPAKKRSFNEVKGGIILDETKKYIAGVRGRYITQTNSPEGVYVNAEAIGKLFLPTPAISNVTPAEQKAK